VLFRSDGARQAIEHLCGLGHQRVGFLGPRDTGRFADFVAAMMVAGLSPDKQYNCEVEAIPAGDSLDQWRVHACHAFGQWLDKGFESTAMFCNNDIIAFGAIDAMLSRGLKPGKDISLIGYDNLEERNRISTEHSGLTTIDNPHNLIGHRLGELLLNQILDGQTQVVHERIPVKLIIRQSTGPCRV